MPPKSKKKKKKKEKRKKQNMGLDIWYTLWSQKIDLIQL